MAFPFFFEYKAELNIPLTENGQEELLDLIAEYISEKKADHVLIVGDQVKYNGATTGFNWNTFHSQKGTFFVSDNGASYMITYRIYFYRLLIFVTIAAIFFTILSDEMLSSLLICYGWLGGMNMLITHIRHRALLKDIVWGIEDGAYTSGRSM